MLITFEGGEGAGKTTLINRLAEKLSSLGIDFIKTREPGGTLLSEHIRLWLLNRDFDIPVGKKAELLLFLSARVQHLEELILPAMKAGKVVLCDRFNDSSVVYQGLARGLGFEKTEKLCDLVCDGLKPDLTLFLDVEPEIGLGRTQRIKKENAEDGEMDRIESAGVAFHKLVQEGFRRLALENSERIYTIDANQSEEDVFQDALETTLKKIKQKLPI